MFHTKQSGITLGPSSLPLEVASKATAAPAHGQRGRAEYGLLSRPAKGWWSSPKV